MSKYKGLDCNDDGFGVSFGSTYFEFRFLLSKDFSLESTSTYVLNGTFYSGYQKRPSKCNEQVRVPSTRLLVLKDSLIIVSIASDESSLYSITELDRPQKYLVENSNS